MSSAQSRALRDLEARNKRLHALLVAVLLSQGGSVRVPWATLESAMASSVTTVKDGDDMLIWLGEADHRPGLPRPERRFPRLGGLLRG